MVTYYEILEVSRTASKEVITKAYKVLVRKYHPDLEQDETKKEEAKEKMVKINEAYETLSDDIKREKYDNNIALLEEKERREKEIQNRKKETNTNNFNQKTSYSVDRNYGKNNVNNKVNNNSRVNDENFQNVHGSLDNNAILEEQILRAEEEIQQHKQNIVNQMYEDYYNQLRRMGYRVVTKRPLKERIKTYFWVTVIILILLIIYNIPIVREMILKSTIDTIFELPMKMFDIFLTLPIRMIIK